MLGGGEWAAWGWAPREGGGKEEGRRRGSPQRVPTLHRTLHLGLALHPSRPGANFGHACRACQQLPSTLGHESGGSGGGERIHSSQAEPLEACVLWDWHAGHWAPPRSPPFTARRSRFPTPAPLICPDVPQEPASEPWAVRVHVHVGVRARACTQSVPVFTHAHMHAPACVHAHVKACMSVCPQARTHIRLTPL